MNDLMPELVVLRFVGGVLIDQPLPDAAFPMWAGTLERGVAASAGWRRTVWRIGPGGRGWEVATLHVGDVIEFGSRADPCLLYTSLRWRVRSRRVRRERCR